MFPNALSTPKKKTAKKKSRLLTSQPAMSLFVDGAPDVKPNDNPDEIGKPDETNWDDVDKPDEESENECSGPPERHPEFFFDNTLIAVQAGRTLFNVHKYQLAKSEVFSERFKTRKAEGDTPKEGSSPECPIKLKGGSASEFAALLRVLYASHFSSHQPAPEASLVISAFRLANLFRFSELRTFLLPLAEKNLDDIDKILFAREFGIEQWLAPAHARLCQRDESLTGAEARKLGIESVLMITRMREKHRVRSSGSTFGVGSHYCYTCAGMEYTGDYYNCTSCGGYGEALRHTGIGEIHNGAGKSRAGTSKKERGGAGTTGSTTIESELKKWVESGCIVKD